MVAHPANRSRKVAKLVLDLHRWQQPITHRCHGKAPRLEMRRKIGTQRPRTRRPAAAMDIDDQRRTLLSRWIEIDGLPRVAAIGMMSGRRGWRNRRDEQQKHCRQP